ncbi:MAG: hypothetical protein E7466_00010 [Ruminococcaceae bacterium]|nr:hypothetical protein [Oscillospiraceae bacterium]MBQ3215157.1 hypothetical protein [Oscillospiraceae bacterium]
MMPHDFNQWLVKHNLREVFTTSAGDSLYVNMEKRFAVLKRFGEYGAQSFFLDDIMELKTYDDENQICEWSFYTSWRVLNRSTRFSTNEVYMNIRLKNQLVLRLQIFRGVNGNIKRDTPEHVNMFNYAYQLTQVVYNTAFGASQY